jgi:hypothetical protein
LEVRGCERIEFCNTQRPWEQGEPLRSLGPGPAGQLQTEGLVVVQVPVFPPAAARTHRAGVMHVGPFAVSHEPPSTAGATQMPLFELPVCWQNAPALQSMTPPSMVPQARVAPTVATRSQTRPSGTLQ